MRKIKTWSDCGFTLVELLVVVAVLGILAAIAVPNFINAQMRSKVVRAYADMKNISIAIEQYAIDHERCPSYHNPIDEVGALGGASETYLPITLTTPVAYLSALPDDPFPLEVLAGSEEMSEIKPYKYIHGYDQIYKNQFFLGEHIQLHYETYSGMTNKVFWQIWSLGPDKIVAHDGVAYDLSNGIFSYGDIARFGP